MKLLFDQNLPRQLVSSLESLYPESQHVRSLGMETASDDAVWEYARLHDMMIVSKDSDFYHRSMLFGHPPKVVWLRLGNCTIAELRELLRLRHDDVRAFESDVDASYLILP